MPDRHDDRYDPDPDFDRPSLSDVVDVYEPPRGACERCGEQRALWTFNEADNVQYLCHDCIGDLTSQERP